MNAGMGNIGRWGMIAAVTAAFTGVGSESARADVCLTGAGQQAALLARTAQHLAEDIQFELRGSPHFAHLQQDAAELVQTTRHLCASLAQGASIAHLQNDLGEVSEAQQHLQGVLLQTGSTPAIDRAMARVAQQVAGLNQQLALTVVPMIQPVPPQPVLYVPRYPTPVTVPGRPIVRPGNFYANGPTTFGYGQGGSRGVAIQLGNVRLMFAQ